MKSIELGGPHGLTLSVQPIVLMGSSPEQLMPALLIELTIRDATRPLLCSAERADRCTQGLDEISHMFTADGRTVLYQNAASQAYLGHVAGMEDLIGARGPVAMACDRHNSLLQHQPAGDDDEARLAGCYSHQDVDEARYSHQGALAPAPVPTCSQPTSWLHQLFVLDAGSLEQMMAVTSLGGVWR